jgi:trehalose 6-phosphate phosphatase
MSQLIFPPGVQACIDSPRDVAFLVDFDGTLVHFAPHPDDVIVPHELIENLRRIAADDRLAFAFVTGRSLRKLDSFLDGITTPAVGSHGAEWRRGSGEIIQALAQPSPLSMRRAMEIVSERHGCIFEDKFYTVSMHLPYAQMHKDLVPELAAAAAAESDTYIIRRIDRTYEILQKGVNKGFGIRHLMQLPAFAGKKPFYIGDDVETDNSLDVVAELGGLSLAVRNVAAHEVPNDVTFMGIDAARSIVASLVRE